MQTKWMVYLVSECSPVHLVKIRFYWGLCTKRSSSFFIIVTFHYTYDPNSYIKIQIPSQFTMEHDGMKEKLLIWSICCDLVCIMFFFLLFRLCNWVSVCLYAGVLLLLLFRLFAPFLCFVRAYELMECFDVRTCKCETLISIKWHWICVLVRFSHWINFLFGAFSK